MPIQQKIISINLNQSNLQNYLDCPRRFELNALEEKSWPAATIHPLSAVEKSIQLGNRFHQISQQFFSGISPEQIRQSITDPTLVEMWDAFMPFARTIEGSKVYFEKLLHIPFNNHRLVAKFDLVVQQQDRYWIIDWKTSPKSPPLSILSERVQTFLYPYIFTIAGPELFDTKSIEPEAISFTYWYPLLNQPEISFNYSSEKYQQTKSKLISIINQIEEDYHKESQFPLTDDLDKCLICSFRSICDRGSMPGELQLFDDMEEYMQDEIHLEIEQICELEF